MTDKPLPRDLRRILDARDEILGGDSSGAQFLHAVLAQCSLPYREPPDGADEYKRSNGRAHVFVQSGYLLDPVSRQPVKQGLPFGAKPRLLMIHACSEAVRLQSPKIPIADSMSSFMRQLGFGVTGGARGTVTSFKDQINRLAAARMQLMYAGEKGGTTINEQMFSRIDIWFPSDPRQRMLWPSELTLSAEFYASLVEHALPLDPRSIRALQNSARSLDVYTWLAHRLPRIKSAQGDAVSWQALFAQFGGELTNLRDFKKKFIKALREACAVYPVAKLEESDKGLRLYPSPPSLPKLSTQKRSR